MTIGAGAVVENLCMSFKKFSAIAFNCSSKISIFLLLIQTIYHYVLLEAYRNKLASPKTS